MKILLLILLALSPGQLRAETITVPSVDLNRYLGAWYEIASVPQFFSRGCTCTKAQYGVRSDGDISVVNSCNKDSVDGPLSVANGRAKVADPSNAKLRVSFQWPFYGDYWIVGLDRQYRYSVVSNREGTSLWILSRTPSLSKTLFQEAVRAAKNAGVDISKLQTTTQKGCRYQ